MSKKRTNKIEKQIVSKVTVGLILLFIFIVTSSTIIILRNVSKLSNTAFETVSIGIQNSVEKFEVESMFLTGIEEDPEYLKFISDLEKYRKSVETFSDKLLIIAQRENNYSYIYGFDQNKDYKLGDSVINIEPELKDAVLNGKGYYPELTIKNLINKGALEYCVIVNDVNGEKIAILLTLKTSILVSVLSLLLIILMIEMALILLIVYIVVRVSLRKEMIQLDTFGKHIVEVSELKGDLTKRIAKVSDNEIGVMTEHLNKLLDTVHHIMSIIVKTSSALNDGMHKFENLMTNAKLQTHSIDDSIFANKIFIQQKGASADALNNNISEINASITEVASSMNYISDISSKTSFDIEGDKDNMKNLKKYVIETVDQVSVTADKVSTLKSQSDEISSIVDSIHEISNQTNLLALNASIEAARAGENGRGFAVVADEVRKLAENSSLKATSIEHLIHSIQRYTNEVQLSMSETLMIINEETTMIESFEIKYNEIMSGVLDLTQQVKIVNKNINSITKSSILVKEEMENLMKFSMQSDNSVDNMINQSLDQNKNIQNLSEQIKNLSSIAEELQSMVNQLIL